MYVYHILNRKTLKIDLIFGYNIKDAFRRANIADVKDWDVVAVDYEDQKAADFRLLFFVLFVPKKFYF